MGEEQGTVAESIVAYAIAITDTSRARLHSRCRLLLRDDLRDSNVLLPPEVTEAMLILDNAIADGGTSAPGCGTPNWVRPVNRS
ncbi:hypothetical protein [Streptomyces sp. NBC_00989]|uniref:hypothetical protein n=1 Tax=Streptomyces sp. NBC_00989 TaxID=2903705 RepID=UPI00386B1629|nr:hypothetical protein OG714_54440 [Streptomyces sp. NBC_00989]